MDLYIQLYQCLRNLQIFAFYVNGNKAHFDKMPFSDDIFVYSALKDITKNSSGTILETHLLDTVHLYKFKVKEKGNYVNDGKKQIFKEVIYYKDYLAPYFKNIEADQQQKKKESELS